ncbi:MAG TPA: hypothetical protein VJN44_15385 [Roseateles sp.]|nr:hypothetical protein [Roseateles sp.]
MSLIRRDMMKAPVRARRVQRASRPARDGVGLAKILTKKAQPSGAGRAARLGNSANILARTVAGTFRAAFYRRAHRNRVAAGQPGGRDAGRLAAVGHRLQRLGQVIALDLVVVAHHGGYGDCGRAHLGLLSQGLGDGWNVRSSSLQACCAPSK